MKSLTFKIIIIASILIGVFYLLYNYGIVPFTSTHEYVYDFGKQYGLKFDARPANLTSFISYSEDSIQLGYVPVLHTNDFRVSIPVKKTLFRKQSNTVSLEITFKAPKELADLRVRTENTSEWKNIYSKLLDNLGSVKYSKGSTKIWAKEDLFSEEQEAILNQKVIPDTLTRPLYTFNTILTSKIPTALDEKTEYSYDIFARGSHKGYIYLPGNELNISIKKYDLNWYDGRDDVLVSILSVEGKKLYSFTIEDDGITSTDEKGGKIIQEKKETYALNAGIYQIDIQAGDSIITNISGNFSHFVLSEHYFLAASSLYRDGIAEGTFTDSSMTEFFTNYKNFSLFTTHTASLQKLQFGTVEATLDTVNKPIKFTSSTSDIVKVSTETPDLIMAFDGFLSPTEKAFFRPFPINTSTLDGFSNITNDAIIVGNYEDISHEGEFVKAVTTFELESLPDNLTFEFSSSNLGVIPDGLEIKQFVVKVK